MAADQPHPELGGGLFCLLQLPHELQDHKRLQQLCIELNNMEMAENDLPPHFGAWCEGKLTNNPAYISFFPNGLYSASGIAVNVALWALNRANWANEVLASLQLTRREEIGSKIATVFAPMLKRRPASSWCWRVRVRPSRRAGVKLCTPHVGVALSDLRDPLIDRGFRRSSVTVLIELLSPPRLDDGPLRPSHPDQIAEARRLAREWKPTNSPKCWSTSANHVRERPSRNPSVGTGEPSAPLKVESKRALTDHRDVRSVFTEASPRAQLPNTTSP